MGIGSGLGFAAAVTLLLAALFAGESFSTAAAAILVAGGWGALAAAGLAPASRRVLLPGLVLALAAWSGISIAWSVAPDLSWDELNRTLVYAAFLAVGLLFGARAEGACGRACVALAVALGAAVLWALAGKVVPPLFPDGARAARLRDPIGYWNALALAGNALLVLGVWLAASERRRVLRLAGVVLAYAAVAAIFLSVSRTGLAAAVAGVALWLWLARARLEAAALALAAALPAGAVAAWAFTRPALVESGQERADRVADGALLGVVLVVGAALAALAADRILRRDSPRLRGRVPAAAALGALAVTILAVGLAVAVGSRESAGESPSRLFDPSANNRLEWWGEALRIVQAEPLTGAGAGTFEVARKRYREQAVSTSEPHSVPLQFLAGTGPVGLVLFLGLVGAAGWAAHRALRRLAGAEREAAAALAAVPALWLLHALVDYPWDFAAVTGPALFAVGVLAAAGREPVRVRQAPAAAAVAAASLCVLASVASPWLAERSLRDVLPALERRDVEAAADAASRARSLDPLALGPLFARARVHEAEREFEAARGAYADAVRLQPENPASWLELGLFEASRGALCPAYRHLNEAYTLDPAGTQWVEGGPLDRARAWVNAGNCR